MSSLFEEHVGYKASYARVLMRNFDEQKTSTEFTEALFWKGATLAVSYVVCIS